MGYSLIHSVTLDVCAFGYVTREWEVFPDGRVREIIAGPPYYFSAALAKLGDKVRVVTRVAEEDVGILEGLRGLGIEVVNIPAKSTMKSRLLYKPSGREIEVLSRGEPFVLDDLRLCRDVGTKYVYLGPLSTEDFSLEFVREAASIAPVVLDVQGFTRKITGGKVEYVDWAWKADAAPSVSVLKLDDKEGKLLTGAEEPEDIIDSLHSIGFREVLLTTAWGIFIGIMERGIFSAPFKVKEIKGRTGRGDTATAAYVHSKLKGLRPAEAAVFTAAATSLKLMKPGPLSVDEGGVLRFISEAYDVGISVQ